MLDLIRKAILHLFGLKQVVSNQQARIAELTAINEQLRHANDLDSVSLRRAAEAAAADVRTAQAKNEALELQIAENNAAGVELAAAINDHPETPIVDETWSVLAPSGVPAVVPRESLTEEQQEQADSVPAVATNQELSQEEIDAIETTPIEKVEPDQYQGPGDYPAGLPPEKPAPAVEELPSEAPTEVIEKRQRKHPRIP